MSKIEALDHNAKDSSDWNQAWRVVARLAKTRGTTLRQIREDYPSEPIASAEAAQLARDTAEIERAAAAQWRAEPVLEPRALEPEIASEVRPSRSIWPLLGVIWLTAVMIVSCTIGAIVLLLG